MLGEHPKRPHGNVRRVDFPPSLRVMTVEQIAGFYLIDVPDLPTAVELASCCRVNW